MEGISGRVMELCDWGVKLAWLNVLWIMYTLAGLVVLGIFPATAAAHHTIRTLIKGEDQKAGKVFREYYRREWKNTNKLGYLFFSIGAILYIDYSFFRSFPSIYALLASYLCFILLAVWLFGFITVFSLYVHYDMKSFGYVKNSIYLLLGYPATFFLLAAGLLLIAVILFYIPGLLPFFAISGPIFFIEWACSRRFHKLHPSRAG
ncbi:DUF624 domain-containing protein [Metabacillus sp. FJAT-52054]|uniref:DUF624 domain-containing protein n=1 Tax=Metabacillus sediminis TaxID=3117746 RepID=A0ABZ2ND87_9BACI